MPIHREDMKAGLRKQFGSLLAFERAKGLPEGSAKDVLRGRAVAQTERAISEALGKPLHRLFPQRYETPEQGESSAKVDDSGQSESAHLVSRSGAR